MLVNPRSANAKASGLSKSSQFSAPIPGQSLTDEPGKWAWEKPTKFVDVNDAFRHVVNLLADDPMTMSSFEKLMAGGVSVEEITRTITFGGFAAGLWTVDMAEFLQPPVSAVLALHAKEAGIPFKMFVHQGRSPIESEIPEELVLQSMKEKNPEALKQLIDKNARQITDTEQKLADMAPPPELEGFLGAGIEEGEI